MAPREMHRLPPRGDEGARLGADAARGRGPRRSAAQTRDGGLTAGRRASWCERRRAALMQVRTCRNNACAEAARERRGRRARAARALFARRRCRVGRTAYRRLVVICRVDGRTTAISRGFAGVAGRRRLNADAAGLRSRCEAPGMAHRRPPSWQRVLRKSAFDGRRVYPLAAPRRPTRRKLGLTADARARTQYFRLASRFRGAARATTSTSRRSHRPRARLGSQRPIALATVDLGPIARRVDRRCVPASGAVGVPAMSLRA